MLSRPRAPSSLLRSCVAVRARALVTALAALCIVAGACKRESPPEPASTPPRPVAVQPAAAASLSERISRPVAPRIVAIGDLHGDMGAVRRALRLAGAIDASNKWIGGSLIVVQTGDQIDRGDDDRAILDAFDKWADEAKAAGGELLSLLGNHEIMNVMLDFRYVTPGAYTTFADVKADTPFGADAAGQFGEKARGRVLAFAPGGTYAKRLAQRPVIARIGDSVFVHGGLLDKHITYGLDLANDEVRAFLNGKVGKSPAIVTGEDGLVWLRTYSQDPTPTECASLRQALSRLNAKRLVVGHTVQDKKITQACDGAVHRIDVGMSSYYRGPISVLEIKGDAVTPLVEK